MTSQPPQAGHQRDWQAAGQRDWQAAVQGDHEPAGQRDHEPAGQRDHEPAGRRDHEPAGQRDHEPAGRRDHEPADRAVGRRFRADPDPAGEERWAMLSYLGVPFLGFLIPLAIRLTNGRRPGFLRDQATQALNLSVTGLLYTFCALLLGGILALDSLSVALLIAVPAAAALWIATLVYVIRAAAAASRGAYLQIPAWICATMWR